jgi:hypothetical protein
MEVGLHTSCYVVPDYEARFREETARFVDTFGFQPRSFTVHGLGDFRADVRQRLVETIGRDPGSHGYVFSDCDPSLREYEYVITDCHIDPESDSRQIYEDVVALPPFLAGDRDYLVLIHPCYWR